MESKHQGASTSMNLVIRESDAMIEANNKEMSAMCEFQHNLEKREARNENEKRKLSRKQRQHELAYQKQKEADMRKQKLAEEHKREKEALQIRINNLMKKIDHKQAIELKVEKLKGTLRVEHVEHQDMEAKKKMEAIAEELEERDKELEAQEIFIQATELMIEQLKHVEHQDMETKKNMEETMNEVEECEEELEAQMDFRQALILKENKSKEEMHEARRELINNLENYSSNGRIVVKIVGVLDAKPFEVGAMARYSEDIAPGKAAEMWSLWESYLRDTNWHPFKFVSKEGGITKEVIDEEDERLKGLRTEVGEEAYKAVVTALIELNESNPEGRTPVRELWNTKEGRRAEVSEAAEHLANILRNQKRRKNFNIFA